MTRNVDGKRILSHNYHICSLIFFPSNSIVLILKSIPAEKEAKKSSNHVAVVTHHMMRIATGYSGVVEKISFLSIFTHSPFGNPKTRRLHSFLIISHLA
jgi:hypothetical protein